MNKSPLLVLAAILIVFSFGKVSSYASESDDKSKVNLNGFVRIDDSNIFQFSGEGKNKTQFRTRQHKNDEETEFMLKGVIDATSANLITIDGKLINIDSSETEELKIVGNLEVGAYAMVKGEIKDSTYFAEKIVVNQRNKMSNQNEDEIDDDQDEDATPSATPTPTISDDEDDNATMTAQLDFGIIINTIQNFLNYLRDIASRI